MTADQSFAAAYEDGVGRLSGAVEAAIPDGGAPRTLLAAGLRAGLDFLASDPPLANLLLVEALAASSSARLAHERSLDRLAAALQASVGVTGGASPGDERARLLAGGLVSHVTSCVLAGEAELLPESRDLLLGFLLEVGSSP